MFIAGFPAGAFQANCYLIATEPGAECIIVDPGQQARAGIESALAEHNLMPTAVLFTHGHFDHVADGAAVCAEHGIPAYLHPADAFMLSDPLAGLSPEFASLLAGLPISGLCPETVKDLADGQLLELAGLAIAVDHTPGHTQGSVVFRFANNNQHPEVLLTGDTLFAGSVGRTDLVGGNTTQLIESISAKLLTRADDAVILPGHGPGSHIGAERQSNPFLQG